MVRKDSLMKMICLIVSMFFSCALSAQSQSDSFAIYHLLWKHIHNDTKSELTSRKVYVSNFFSDFRNAEFPNYKKSVLELAKEYSPEVNQDRLGKYLDTISIKSIPHRAFADLRSDSLLFVDTFKMGQYPRLELLPMLFLSTNKCIIGYVYYADSIGLGGQVFSFVKKDGMWHVEDLSRFFVTGS